MTGAEQAESGGGTRLRVGGWLPDGPPTSAPPPSLTPPPGPDAPQEQVGHAGPGPATAELPQFVDPVGQWIGPGSPDHAGPPAPDVEPPVSTTDVEPVSEGAQPSRRGARAVLLPVGALTAVAVVVTGTWLLLGRDGGVTTSFSAQPSGTAATGAPADAQLRAAPRTPAATSSPSRSAAPSSSASSTASPKPTRSDQPRTLSDPYAGYPNPPAVAGMRLLGPADYSGYCSSRGAGSAAVSGGQWRCTGSGQTGGFTVQVTDACRWTYHSRQVVAAAYDTSDPYSWRCYSRH